MTLADDVGYKIGGVVPVWVAALGLSGGYLFIERRRKNAAAAAAAATQTSPTTLDTSNIGGTSAVDPTTGVPYSTELQQQQDWTSSPVGQYLSNDPNNAAYPVGITPGGLTSPISNAQWAEIAENFLVSKGDEPIQVTQAIQNFINGNPLSATDQAFINLAIAQLGEPPQPLSPNLSGSAPTGPSPSGPPVPPSPKPNAYPVGAKVGPYGERVVEAVEDPHTGGWLDLTDEYGIWGSGDNVSGSGFNPKLPRGKGHLVLINNGTQVAEYGPNGEVLGIYKVT